MGKRYIPHSDLCGCSRCAAQGDTENPQQVFDVVEDPEILDCGCDRFHGCRCDDYE